MNATLKTSLLGLALLAAGAASSCKSTHHGSSSTSSTTSTASTSSSSTARTSSTGSSATPSTGAKPPTAPPTPRTSMPTAGMTTSKFAYPTGDERTSALVLAKKVPNQVMANEPFTYEYEITNVSSLPLDDVKITETPSTNFTMTSSSVKAMTTGGNNVWNVGSLSPGQSAAITVTGSAKSTGNVDSCTTIDYQSGLCSTIAVVKPALDVKVAGPAEVTTCDEICYKYTVTNTGTGMARNVVLRGNLPNGMTTKDGKSSFSRNIGDLREGGSATYDLCVDAAKGSYQRGGTAAAEGTLTAESNRVATVVKQPVLTIEKTGKDSIFAGQKIKYSIVVRNTGDGVAEGVKIVDTLPAGTTFVSASMGRTPTAGKVEWPLGNLQPGEERTVELELKANQIGNVPNTAECQGTCAPKVSKSSTCKVGGIPAILLEVVDIEDPVAVGDETTYVITVTNQGTAEDTNIVIKAQLPPNTSYVSSSGPVAGSSGMATGRDISFAKHPRLAPKAEIEYRITVRGDSAADARFRVSMNSDNLTSEAVEETEATNFYE